MSSKCAEKQRRYRERIKADPVMREEHLRKERERWKKRIESGKVSSVKDLTKREKRYQRKKWRESKKKSREKKLRSNHGECEVEVSMSRQRIHARKKQLQNKTKSYREIHKLKKLLHSSTKKYERVKKRYLRLKNKSEENNKETPRSKTRKLLRNTPVSDNVRKTLVFHHALVDNIKEKYMKSKQQKQKQMLSSLISSKILAKYKLKNRVWRDLKISQKYFSKVNNDGPGLELSFPRKKRSTALQDTVLKKVHAFYERDDCSRITTSKKDTVTLAKQKRQRRIMCDTIKNLHRKYLSEHNQDNLSYSLFCRLKPFWITPPKPHDSESCLCKKHENLKLLSKKLYNLNVIPNCDLSSLVALIACDITQKNCMYNECKECKLSVVKTNTLDMDLQVLVMHYQWVTKMEKRNKSGKENTEREVKVTIKDALQCTLDALITKFHDQLSSFKRHHYNICHQYSKFREVKQNLGERECVIHVDFSENYTCKYSKEIQAVHFGSSHKQATLHTGILYTSCKEPIPFCTISSSKQHDPPAIWEHLNPILLYVKEHYPLVSTIHFLTDGPTTQYRQKGNFFLFCTKIYEMGFKSGTWNFFEAGHGKGAPDGVGAALKRTADEIAAHGSDVNDAAVLFHALSAKESKIKLFWVGSNVIERATAEMRQDLLVVPGTMRIHQVITVSPFEIFHRETSCFCNQAKSLEYVLCNCYKLNRFTFQTVFSTEINIEHSHNKKFTVVEHADPLLIGQWCVVNYDRKPYPGLILSVDEIEGIEVKCMHQIGPNRYFMPNRDDILWYDFENIVTIIPEPKPTSMNSLRHMEISNELWPLIQQYFGELQNS